MCHIKTRNFLYKNPRVIYSIFFIATNTANKPLSDCITSSKTILPFHFSPKPTAEGETKRQQSKQLQFHKFNTKKKEHMSHSYYLTPIEPSFQHLSIRPLEQTVKFVCSSLNVTNPKTRKRLICIHSQIKSTDFQTASGYNTIQNFRQNFPSKFLSTICVSKVYLYLTRQYNLILLLRATKLVLSTKIILNYTFITKYDISAKLPNTQPTEYPSKKNCSSSPIVLF